MSAMFSRARGDETSPPVDAISTTAADRGLSVSLNGRVAAGRVNGSQVRISPLGDAIREPAKTVAQRAVDADHDADHGDDLDDAFDRAIDQAFDFDDLDDADMNESDHVDRSPGASSASGSGKRRADAARASAREEADKKRMHRINTVRQREGVSLRSASRRLHVDIRRLRAQEDESSDILLSTLYEWQKVLDVPIQELLVDANEPVSPIVLQRARMVKIMKTVAAIRERAEQKSVQRLAEMLCDQLLEIMPELKDISPWHSVGQRRSANDLGRAAERRMPDDFFIE